jgi:predicted O-methyltransferase YrrM
MQKKNMIDKKLESYIEAHTTPEDAVMKQLNRETHLKTYYPNMLSGAVQGKVLEMISRMLQPKNILEVGTFTGYSAIALARGLADGGQLTTIEANEEMEGFIQSFLEKAGLSSCIKLVIGNAIEVIPDLNETFDLVFIDADKEQYVDYYDLAIPKVRKGGFLLADNVLWDGKVIEPDGRSDKETMGIKAFNKRVKADERVEQVMLSVRDGLMLIRKI